ncbi:ABC transporter [Paenibacillus albidus]|uniref:ABC transporter n=1 Tax=Paenibacillus albidus TaxID=2041023 RepID=A0A917D196_9BACL|nr:ATP-binding cassette domain-containing protein [Paenibacillus albidus]GGG07110.1 ABC transporter [Paenibacillus albidus]
MIEAQRLKRVYKVAVRDKGIKAAFKSLFQAKYTSVEAVKGIGFSIARGEIVALLGPNGAGKTTTLKMLAGLVHPSEGELAVNGFKPFKRDRSFLKSISLLMGNRKRLNWNLPVVDSFELYKELYDIPEQEYQSFLDELIELMDVAEIIQRPVRNLSLGQRMKCEIILSLLHKPQVLFLDEPTIGLDNIAQKNIRNFIKEYNKRYNATVIITSHNMDDIESLCKRVLIINRGELVYDGDMKRLTDLVSNEKRIVITCKDNPINMEQYGTVQSMEDGRIELLIERDRAVEIIPAIMTNPWVQDIDITNIPLTEIIERVYTYGLSYEPK